MSIIGIHDRCLGQKTFARNIRTTCPVLLTVKVFEVGRDIKNREIREVVYIHSECPKRAVGIHAL